TSLVSPATGKSYFVSTSGSDETNDGTFDSPWASIPHADSIVQPGDTVYVMPGIYNVSGAPEPWFYTHASGTADNYIHFVSYSKWQASISGIAWLAEGSYVEVSGFDFVGGPGGGAIDILGDYTNATGNRIHDLGQDGCFPNGAIAQSGNAGASY